MSNWSEIRERLNDSPDSDRLRELLDEARKIAESKTAVNVQRPEDVAALVMYDMAKLEQEEMWVVLLNTRNHVIKVVHLYKGSLNSSLIRIGEIYREAVRENAAAIIVCHNHPSGDPSPSPEDVAVTKAIIKAGDLLDIDLLDHIIVGNGRFVSMKAKGLAFGE